MVSGTTILVAWIVVGLAITLWIKNRGFKRFNVSGGGLLLTWHTQKGKKLIERISKSRIWGPMGDIGIVVIAIAGISAVIGLLFSLHRALTMDVEGVIQQPKNFLIVPGVNDFLPLSEAPAIVIALLIAMIVHEFGHGILCRANNIDVKSLGVAFISLIPMGAFVQPDEESQEAADTRSKLRMVSAGVTNNLIVFIVCIIGLILLSSYVIVPMSGGAVTDVYPGSSAEEAGLEGGTVITSVNGESVSTKEEMLNQIEQSGEEVTVTDSEGQTYQASKSIVVSSSYGTLEVGDKITAVEGTEVNTEGEFREAISSVASTEEISITTQEETISTWIGALGQSSESNIIVTEIDGERVISGEDMSSYSGTVSGTYIQNGEVNEGPIDIDEFNFVGGYSGVSFVDYGVVGKSVGEQHSYLAGDNGIAAMSAFTMISPFVDGLGGKFSGFLTNPEFYQVTVPVIPDYVVLLFASVLFWSAFININLFFINSLPAIPLDGGHVVRYSSEYFAGVLTNNKDVISKTGVAVQIVLTLVMISSFLTIVFMT
jgi:membrane-associated protease RseP (regulator of RpoE activity)